MRTGKYASQAAHASMAFLTTQFAGMTAIISNNEERHHWLENSFRKIVCYVETEEELLAIFEKAKNSGLTAHLITDNGATEFNGIKTHTAVAIGPHWDEKFIGLTDGLKLF